MGRRTRIVATLGPASDAAGVLERLLDMGLNVARINFSHGTADEHKARIARLRELAQARGAYVAVLADLPGPKLRAKIKEPMPLQVGQKLTIGCKPDASADLTLTEPEVLAKAKVGQRVLLDDGRLQARIAQTGTERVTIAIEVGGTLLPNKGINLPDTELAIPSVTARDRDAIKVAAEAKVDWLALSFVRDPSAAHELRAVARAFDLEAPILAKMERPEAVAKADDIIRVFDGIMVARGDLGVEIALEKVPHVQKRLIYLARKAGKPVITATDMLDSMRTNPRPTRAEASDVANAVYDGTDAVMLSGETAVGQYPVEAITCMNNILIEAETHLADDGARDIPIAQGDVTDHITHMTCQLAHDIRAQAIIVPSITGRTPRLVSRHRPAAAIVAPSRNEAVLRSLAVSWGVIPVPNPVVAAGEDRMHAAVKAAFDKHAVKVGDLAVVLAGHPIEGAEPVPTIRVVRVAEEGRSSEP